MVILPLSRILRVSTKPPFTSPIRRQSSRWTSSITSSAVSLERMPSFPCSGRCEKPGRPFSSRNAVTPFCLSPGSVSASTTKTSPTVPWVMNILVPFSNQPLSLRTAVVRIPAASLPLPGSVSAQAASFFPAAMSGMKRLRSSSLPKRNRCEVPRPLCDATVNARDPSQRAISSTTQATDSVSSAEPPSSSGTLIPSRPSSPMCSTTSLGKRSSRSHSCACGFTSRTQKSRTVATSLRWLSFSSKSKWLSVLNAALSRGALLAHHQLARGQRDRIVGVAALPINPDVQRVLPTRQLAQPRSMAAAQLQGELVFFRGKRRIEDHVRALAAVDPQLLPDLAGPVLADGLGKVAPPVDRVGGREDCAQGGGIARAPLQLAGREDAISVAALALDFPQAAARHPTDLGDASAVRRLAAQVEESRRGEQQGRRCAARDCRPQPRRPSRCGMRS